MGYPSKLQCIKRKNGWRQYYLNIPAALAEALDCQEGEMWAFTIVDRKQILLERSEDPRVPPLRKGK
jgi:bifunctional DNA-binding transcriptional regulator/antitoxin component of YhaV-PrlF toxin-antitoxin module